MCLRNFLDSNSKISAVNRIWRRKIRAARHCLAVGCAGLSAFLLSGCGTQNPNVAPYKERSTGKLSLGDDPVETSVYKYDPQAKTKFRFVGEPVTFRFPRQAYTLRANFDGGAQRVLWLEYDLKSSRPMMEAIQRENSEADSVDSVARLRPAYRDRILQIIIYALNDFRNPRPQREIERLESRIDVGLKYVTNECKVNWYVISESRRSQAFVPGFTAEFFDFKDVDLYAIVKWQDEKYILSCTAKSPICWIRFAFHGMPTLVSVPRERICEHEILKNAAENIMKKHLVAR